MNPLRKIVLVIEVAGLQLIITILGTLELVFEPNEEMRDLFLLPYKFEKRIKWWQLKGWNEERVKEEARKIALKNGWTPEQIDEALNEYK